MTEKALIAATNPAAAVDALREAAEGIGEVVWAGLNPAPETPLNVDIGPHRRYAVVRNRLEDFRYVKRVLGGTVNDVVLAVVSGSLARWLRSRGVRTEGLELRALVPVSIRPQDQRHQLGNQIVLMRGPLPVYIRDPVARLRFVKEAMDGLKESKQAVGAKVLADVQQLAPPTILAQASRVQFSTRLFNLITTNVPGPQFPLYVLGRELLDLFPIAFLPKNHALAIAIMSYNGCDRLRPARRLRRAAGHRADRRRDRGRARPAEDRGACEGGADRRRARRRGGEAASAHQSGGEAGGRRAATAADRARQPHERAGGVDAQAIAAGHAVAQRLRRELSLDPPMLAAARRRGHGPVPIGGFPRDSPRGCAADRPWTPPTTAIHPRSSVDPG